jgi:hypothetical protein
MSVPPIPGGTCWRTGTQHSFRRCTERQSRSEQLPLLDQRPAMLTSELANPYRVIAAQRTGGAAVRFDVSVAPPPHRRWFRYRPACEPSTIR